MSYTTGFVLLSAVFVESEAAAALTYLILLHVAPRWTLFYMEQRAATVLILQLFIIVLELSSLIVFRIYSKVKLSSL